MGWMSPVQVCLGTNNSQARGSHHTSVEGATNIASGAATMIAGSTPAQLLPPTLIGIPNVTDDHEYLISKY